MKRLALLAVLLASAVLHPRAQTNADVMPLPRQHYEDAGGLNPCSGCKLYAYAAGTLTPLDTYHSPTLAVGTENPWPLVMNSAGRPSVTGSEVNVYLTKTGYKFILKTAADVVIWTSDNVNATNATSFGATGEFGGFAGWIGTPLAAYPSGATFDKLAPGTEIIALDSASLPAGTYNLQAMLVVESAGTVTAALVNLSDGAPDTPIVTVTSTSTTGQQVVSSAITFAPGGASKNYGIKLKGADTTHRYAAWGLRLVRTA